MDNNFLINGLRPGFCIDGKYKVISFLSQGGMGIVYKGVEIFSNRVVAIKLLHNQEHTSISRKKFLREIELVAQLNHKNIVKVIAAGEVGSSLYMVMEYIEGIPLDQYSRNSQMPINDKINIILKIARALEFAHRQNIMHRDIKPDNILITKMGEPKVMDFGLAKLIEKKEHQLTRTGEVSGTPRYMSPEQLAPQMGIDVRTDVYSLGAILYEILTDKHMVVGNTPIEVIFNIARKKPIAIHSHNKNIPKMLVNIWQHSVAPIDSRYKNAGEMADDMEAYLKNQDLGYIKKVKRYSYYYQKTFIVITILVILISIYFIWSFKSHQKTSYNEISLLLETNLQDRLFVDWKSQSYNKETLELLQLRIWDDEKQYLKIRLGYGTEKNEVSIRHNIWQTSSEACLLRIKACYYLNQSIVESDEHKIRSELILNENKLANETPQKLHSVLREALFYIVATKYREKKFSEVILLSKNKFTTKVYYTNDAILLDNLWDLYIAHSYLESYKSTGNNEDLQQSYHLLKELYQKKEMLNNIVLLEKLSECAMLLKEWQEAEKYLSLCCELHPENSDYVLQLGRIYLALGKSHHACMSFKKAIALDNDSLEPLNGMLELAVNAPRFNEEAFWHLFPVFISRGSTKKPDLLWDEILKIKEENKGYYQEFLSIENTSGDLHSIANDLYKENYIAEQAIKTLLLKGYREDITKITSYLKPKQKDHKNIEDLVSKIVNRASWNKKRLLYYLLADFYLNKNEKTKSELLNYQKSVVQILNDKELHIIMRYLAAKVLVTLYCYDDVILGQQQTQDRDLLLVCKAVLREASFIFSLEELCEQDFKIENIHEILLYDRILEVHDRFFYQLLPEYQIAEPQGAKLFAKIIPLMDSPNETFRVIGAANIFINLGEPEIIDKADKILQNYILNSQNQVLSVYANYYYWHSYYFRMKTIHYIDNYLKVLETTSDESVLVTLNSRYIYKEKNIRNFLAKNNDLHQRIIKIIESVATNSKDQETRLKASFLLAMLAPFQKEFRKLINNKQLPASQRCLTYSAANFAKIIFLKDFISNPKKDINAFEMDILHKEIMEGENDDLLKYFAYKLACLMFGIQIPQYLEHKNNQGENIKASILSSITTEVFSSQLQQFYMLFRYDKSIHIPTRRELRKIATQYQNDSSAKVRFCAWGAFSFLSNNIDETYQNAAKSSDNVVRSGTAWGIYRYLRTKITQPLSFKEKSFFGLTSYYGLYLDTLQKKSLINADEYLKWNQYIIDLESDSAPRSVYYSERAIIYQSIHNNEQALENINKAIMESEKLSLKDYTLRYKIIKASIIHDNEQIFALLQENFDSINDYYTLLKMRKIIEEKHFDLTIAKYKKLYINILKKNLFFASNTLTLEDDYKRYILGETQLVYQKLAFYSDNDQIKKFYQNCYDIIRKGLSKGQEK